MTARLFLEIRDKKRTQLYLVQPLDTDPRVAPTAWRLWKPGLKKFYDIAVQPKGWISCSCPDANWRQRDCKHILGLTENGLIPRKQHEAVQRTSR